MVTRLLSIPRDPNCLHFALLMYMVQKTALREHQTIVLVCTIFKMHITKTLALNKHPKHKLINSAKIYTKRDQYIELHLQYNS